MRKKHRRFVIGLDRHELAWADGRQDQAAMRVPHGQLNAVISAAKAYAGPWVDVVVASDAAQHWVQSPPAGLASFAELRQVAQLRCAHLFGGRAEDWWVAADWQGMRPFICAGLPAGVAHELQGRMVASGLQVQWHTAWTLLCQAKARELGENGWSALRSPERVMLWQCTDGRVSSVAALAMDAQDTDEKASARAWQHVHLENVRSECEPSRQLQWVCLGDKRGAQDLPDVRPVALHLGDGAPLRGDCEAVAALRLGSALAGGAS